MQRVYSTRRSARLSEKLARTEPMEVEFSKVMTKDFDGDEEENKGMYGFRSFDWLRQHCSPFFFPGKLKKMREF